MDHRELRYELVGHVGVVTLDRPEARNALTHRTYAELEDAEAREHDPTVVFVDDENRVARLGPEVAGAVA